MTEPKTTTTKFHKANKNPVGNWVVYTLLLKRGLKQAFGGVYARIDPVALSLRRKAPYPLIFCLTHSGWYDGHIAAILNERIFKHDPYLMMEEPNLARYWFFTWAGVFGIDRDEPRNALASIEYITDILAKGKNRALWMFPQGTMRHPDERPLKLFGGVANIVRRIGKCAILPVAIRYDFMMDQAPDAFVRIGPPIVIDPGDSAPGSRQLTEQLREAMEAQADRLHTEISAYNKVGYKLILVGRGSINRKWDNVLKLFGKVKRSVRGSRA
jgi:chlorobactene lauroyltransferase